MVLTFSEDRFDVEALSRALAVVACMAIFAHERKVYDLATAAFFAFGLGLMARHEWSLYFSVFALGCLNRETMVLLIGVSAVHFWRRLPRSAWLGLLMMQAAIFLMIRFLLMVAFAESPGALYWWRLEDNLRLLAEIPWLAGMHVLGLALLLGLCVLRWSRFPIFVRHASLVLFPALTALYLLFGWAGEIRVFMEAFPLAWSALTTERL